VLLQVAYQAAGRAAPQLYTLQPSEWFKSKRPPPSGALLNTFVASEPFAAPPKHTERRNFCLSRVKTLRVYDSEAAGRIAPPARPALLN
jgi:hypothetical protein